MTVMPPSHTNRCTPTPYYLDINWTRWGVKASVLHNVNPSHFSDKNGICGDLTESYRRDLVESSRRYSIHIWTVSSGKGFGE